MTGAKAYHRFLLLLHYDQPVTGRQRHVLIETANVRETISSASGLAATLFTHRLVGRAYRQGQKPKVGKVWTDPSGLEERLARRRPFKLQCKLCVTEAMHERMDAQLEDKLGASIEQARQRITKGGT